MVNNSNYMARFTKQEEIAQAQAKEAAKIAERSETNITKVIAEDIRSLKK